MLDSFCRQERRMSTKEASLQEPRIWPKPGIAAARTTPQGDIKSEVRFPMLQNRTFATYDIITQEKRKKECIDKVNTTGIRTA